MRHGSLFSGIGGFDLAAEWMGWENVFQVEWDKWCQKVLAKNFPNSLRFGDIVEFNKMLQDGRITTDTEGAGLLREKELENNSENNGTRRGCNSSDLHKIYRENGEITTDTKRNRDKRNTGTMAEKENCPKEQNDGAEFNRIGKNGLASIGRIDILTGGFPCQPFSHAGKRKGVDDSRYLWPEMLTTIRILKPSFVVGENVAGLVSMENGKTLERILSDLENEGYQTESFIIPACGVGAWHRRDRIWIVCYRRQTDTNTGCLERGRDNEPSQGFKHSSGGQSFGKSDSLHNSVCNSKCDGCEDGYSETGREERQSEERRVFKSAGTSDKSNVGDTIGIGLQRCLQTGEFGEQNGESEKKSKISEYIYNDRHRIQSSNSSTESILGGMVDGLPKKLDGYWDREPEGIPRVATGVKNRVDRLKGLGNAIVPQVAFQIFKAIEAVNNFVENNTYR